MRLKTGDLVKARDGSVGVVISGHDNLDRYVLNSTRQYIKIMWFWFICARKNFIFSPLSIKNYDEVLSNKNFEII